jgi:hypothetical protein
MKNDITTGTMVKNFCRNSAIESGHFMKPKTQWFKDKSKYNRKSKHKSCQHN